jgi:hypothetical protein
MDNRYRLAGCRFGVRGFAPLNRKGRNATYSSS